MWLWPVRFLLRVLLFIGGFFWIPVMDKRDHSKPRQANTFVANHSTMWDSFKVIADNGCCVAAKSDVFKLPIVGTFLKAMGSFSVERDSGEGRHKAVEQFKERAGDLRFPPLLVFPEGTVSSDKILTLFKKGAFVAGKPVQPVCLEFPNKHFDMLLVGGYLSSTWLSLCQFVNYMRVVYLPEYVPSEAEQKDAGLYAHNVRAAMAKEMGVTVTEHSYTDHRVISAARKAGGAVRVDFYADEVTALFGASFPDIKENLKKFVAMDKDKNGVITYEEFATLVKPIVPETKSIETELGEPPVPASKRLFDVFDSDGSGTLDFKEFIVAASVCTAHSQNEHDTLKVLFELSDVNGDGLVSRDEFGFILDKARAISGIHAPEDIKAISDALFPPSPAPAASSADGEGVVAEEELGVDFPVFQQRLHAIPEVARRLLRDIVMGEMHLF